MAIKLTDLGRELRKIRLDQGEVLFDMAGKLNISTALLSAIEVGSKPAPEYLVQRLAQHYAVVAQDCERFDALADLTKKQVKLKLEGDIKTKEMTLAFARTVDVLTPEDVEKILDVLAKYQQK